MTQLPLHEAIALAMHDRLSHTAAAKALGVSQPTVTRWAGGGVRPSLEDLARIEDACGRPRGFILHAAGYVSDVASVEDAVLMDPDLDDAGRAAVLAAYGAAAGYFRARAEHGDRGEDAGAERDELRP